MFGERQRSTETRHITYPLIFNVTCPNIELTLKTAPSKQRCCCVALSPQTPISNLAIQRQTRSQPNKTRLLMALLISFSQIQEYI